MTLRSLQMLLVVCVSSIAQADGIPESLQAYISCLEETVEAPPAGISTVMGRIPQSLTRQQGLEDVNARVARQYALPSLKNLGEEEEVSK